MSNATAAPQEAEVRPLSLPIVRQGLHYCSARCGGGKYCTYEEFREQKTRAEEMARGLGRGWHPIVREHLGWHPAVESPDRLVYVSPYSHGLEGYHAFVTKGSSYVGNGDTPREALLDLAEKCVDAAEQLSVFAAEIESSLATFRRDS